MNKMFRDMIKEICDELNIHYKALSKNWIIMLEKDGVKKFISGFKFDLNGHALGNVLDDKYATYEILKELNFPIIEHNIVYAPNNTNDYAVDCNSISYIEELFFKYNKNVVLKINGGTCGTDVIHITDVAVLKDKYEKLSKKYPSLSLCPFYEIKNEYRAVVLNGEVELLYKKNRPIVIGNGKATVKELLQEFNYPYFKDYNSKDSSKILKNGEIFEYDWRFNLANGAKVSFDIDVEDDKKIKALAEGISKSIGVKFGSIDVIKTTDSNFYTMEINSGVMTNRFIKQANNGYEIVKAIYKKAIENLMKN